jgi:hypothetical protein
MKENKILKWSLILSIVIVANLFFNYSLSLTLNAPNHDEFCPFEKTSQVIEDKEMCEKEDGIWNPAPKSEALMKDTPSGYCDLHSKCNNAYEEVQQGYEQKVFVALVVIGVLVLVGSFFAHANPVLSSALALTAVLDFLIASVRYWGYADELLKVGILFIALVVLIYLAIRKFKDKI